MRTPPRSQGVHHTGGLCDSSGFWDRGVLVTIVGRFRHVRRAVRAQVRAAVEGAASAPGLAGAAGKDLDPRAGARVVLEQPGGCRGHLKRQLVEPLGKGALLLRRSQESFA